MHLLGRLRLSLIGVISSGAAPSAALRLPTMAGVRMRGAGQQVAIRSGELSSPGSPFTARCLTLASQARMMGSVRDLNDQGVEYSVRKTEAAWREAGWSGEDSVWAAPLTAAAVNRREQLSDEEYYVLRQKGTEYPGSGQSAHRLIQRLREVQPQLNEGAPEVQRTTHRRLRGSQFTDLALRREDLPCANQPTHTRGVPCVLRQVRQVLPKGRPLCVRRVASTRGAARRGL